MKVLYLEILPSNRIISRYFVLLLVNIQKSLIKTRDFLGKVLSVYTVPPSGLEPLFGPYIPRWGERDHNKNPPQFGG
jgi:hypothetical protein